MNQLRNVSILFVHLYSILLDTIRIAGAPVLRKISERRGWDFEKRQRLPTPLRDPRGKTVVWIHAASLGEAKLLYKFVDMLKRRHGEDVYLVTATTRSGVAFVEKNPDPSFCAVGFQPIDTISLINRIITHFKVIRVWLVETELWPSLLYVCHKHAIPIGIVNGRIEKKSFQWYTRFKWFYNPLLAALSPVFTQTDQYAQRFAALGVDRASIFVVGNLKGCVIVERPDTGIWKKRRQKLHLHNEAFVVTAGCIHKGEGTVLRQFFHQMHTLGYPCKLIVVPRHLEESSAILKELGNGVLHLDECSTVRDWDICYVEKVGILDDMYSIADAAIVGGTFVPVGGHNVWDAACYAIPVFFGPFFEKQEESCKTLITAEVGFSVDDGCMLGEKMFSVLKKKPAQFIHAQQKFITRTATIRLKVEPLLP